MLHPSYTDLMKVVNKDVEEGETKVVNSRYSIVMATAKRARQLIDGDVPLVKTKDGEKPLSIAIDELNSTGPVLLLNRPSRVASPVRLSIFNMSFRNIGDSSCIPERLPKPPITMKSPSAFLQKDPKYLGVTEAERSMTVLSPVLVSISANSA